MKTSDLKNITYEELRNLPPEELKKIIYPELDDVKPKKNLLSTIDDKIYQSSTVTIDNVEVSKKIVYSLFNEGYELIKEIGGGEGNTRDVFLARFRQGDLDTLRVVKIPKKIKQTSLYLLLNTSKRNIYSHEAKVSGKISCPHISEIISHYKMDGLDVLVEDYFDSKSLKKRLRWGTITDELRLSKIFIQVAQGLAYLHANGKYHRDVKSSNILIDDNDFVKLTDLQNTGVEEDLEDKLLPTRGDSSHTHPSLINAVIQDTASSAKASNDIYGFGATLYETITGNVPLDIKLALSDNGKKIKIGNSEYFAQLKINGESRDSIDEKEHEKMLKHALKGVSPRLKNIIYKCMTTTPKAYTSIDETLADLEKLKTPSKEKWLNRAYDSMKAVAITATIVGTLTAAITYSILHPKQDYVPSISDMLKGAAYATWSGDSLSVFDKNAMWSSLKKTAEQAKEEINVLNTNIKEHPLYEQMALMTRLSHDNHSIDKRLISGLYNAVSTLGNNKSSDIYKDKRSAITCVPLNFVIQASMETSPTMRRPIPDMDYAEESAMAAMYIKGCIGQSKNVSDVYARYFCESEEIFSAQMRSSSFNYFATLDSTGTITEGYRKYLPYKKRELIDKAILFHAISDKDGKLDLNKIPKLYPTTGTSDYDSYRPVFEKQ